MAGSRPKVNKILVPIDFSSTSLGKVRYAAGLPELFGASVCLLHVMPRDSFMQNLCHVGLIRSCAQTVGKQMRRLRASTLAEIAPDLRVEPLLRVGDPVHEIIAVAKTLDMDLIVLSIHGDSWLRHPISSGIVERVVRQQPCLTLTLREELLLSEKTVRAALAWKKILVPFDLTESSRLTVKWAAGMADEVRAKIALRYAPGFLAENPITKVSQQSPLQALKSRAFELRLAEWTRLGGFGWIEVDFLPKMEKPNAHVVGQMLRRAGSDLIVTGSTRSSWWYNLVHSHPSEQLRRVAPCPVLSVPEKDLEYYASEITA